jgi:hypothetical protein
MMVVSMDKQKCKEIMLKYFGPASAKMVERMNDNTCVEECKAIALKYVGPEKTNKIFAGI